MNSSGDPGRDDYGLPPVDIEVPDDARELDRDVQAYRRELRSQRRRNLARRVYGPLTRDGMVLPLLAGCLALTLLAATLLTVFTVGQGVNNGPLGHPGASRSTATPAVPAGSGVALTPATGQPGGLLPDAYVMAAGSPTFMRDLIGRGVLVLALIPRGCKCFNDVRQLTNEAMQGGAQIYLVGMRGTDVTSLPHQLGLGPTHALEDIQHGFPPSYYAPRLAAVLVRNDGSVADIVPDRGHGFRIAQTVRQLSSTHSGTPSPIASATG